MLTVKKFDSREPGHATRHSASYAFITCYDLAKSMHDIFLKYARLPGVVTHLLSSRTIPHAFLEIATPRRRSRTLLLSHEKYHYRH